MDYKNAGDEVLIRQIIETREEALGVLYDRYGRLVFSIAFHIVGDGYTAEEVTLDVFTRVWEKAGTYDASRAKVSVWLTSMARHRAIDILRREGVRPEKESISWSELLAEPASPMGNPETAVDLSLQRQRVRTAVAQLPAEQREALSLAFFRGYSHSEIAQTLAQPLGTVKTRIRLAMQKLRQILPDE